MNVCSYISLLANMQHFFPLTFIQLTDVSDDVGDDDDDNDNDHDDGNGTCRRYHPVAFGWICLQVGFQLKALLVVRASG